MNENGRIALQTPDAIITGVAVLAAEDAQLLVKPVLSAADVHKIRTNGKKLRAWIRLIRSAGEQQRCRKTDRWLRAVSRSLADGRDAKVRMDTLAWLATRTSVPATRAALAELTGPLPEDAGVALPEPVSALQAAKHLRCVTTQYRDSAELRRGVRQVYARTRRLARAAQKPEAHHSDLHRCRRWVKYLGYQLELVTGTKGKKGTPLQQTLTEIGSTLGSIQDLVVLEQHLDSLAADPDKTTAVALTRKLLKATCKRLTTKANGMLAACFAATPAEFVALLK